MDFSIIVNGEIIKEDEINRKYASELDAFTQEFSGDVTQSDYENLKVEVIDKLIDDLLLVQYGKEQKIYPEDEEVQQVINEKKKASDDYNTLPSGELRRQVTNEMIIDRICKMTIEENQSYEDETLKAYFRENKRHFSLGKAVEVSHILVKQNGDVNHSLDQIHEALDKIKSGADFSDVAKKMSHCPSATRGGDLGFITFGSVNKKFEKSVFKLKKNVISDVFKTKHGYHIALVKKKVLNYVPPFSTLKEKLRDFVNETIKKEVIDHLLNELREKAIIEYKGIK